MNVAILRKGSKKSQGPEATKNRNEASQLAEIYANDCRMRRVVGCVDLAQSSLLDGIDAGEFDAEEQAGTLGGMVDAFREAGSSFPPDRGELPINPARCPDRFADDPQITRRHWMATGLSMGASILEAMARGKPAVKALLAIIEPLLKDAIAATGEPSHEYFGRLHAAMKAAENEDGTPKIAARRGNRQARQCTLADTYAGHRSLRQAVACMELCQRAFREGATDDDFGDWDAMSLPHFAKNGVKSLRLLLLHFPAVQDRLAILLDEEPSGKPTRFTPRETWATAALQLADELLADVREELPEGAEADDIDGFKMAVAFFRREAEMVLLEVDAAYVRLSIALEAVK